MIDISKCEQCGITKEESKLKYKNNIHVHHKDCVHENNVLENLMAICAKCHKTIHHKINKKNKESG